MQATGRHVYHCKQCHVVLDMYLNHVGGKPWTPEYGCGEDCEGTFRHPRARCMLSGRDVGHEQAYLEITR